MDQYYPLFFWAAVVIGMALFMIKDFLFYKETEDEWFDKILMFKIIKNNKKKHREFVGSLIKTDKNTHFITQDKTGSLTRVPK